MIYPNTPKLFEWGLFTYIHWLVVWNMNFMTFHINWECHDPNCYSLHHFSEGLAATTTASSTSTASDPGSTSNVIQARKGQRTRDIPQLTPCLDIGWGPSHGVFDNLGEHKIPWFKDV